MSSIMKGIVDETGAGNKLQHIKGPKIGSYADDPWLGIYVIDEYKLGDKIYSTLSYKDIQQPNDVYGTHIFDNTDPKNHMDAVAEIDVYNNKVVFDKNHTGNPKNVWYLLPEDIAMALFNASFPAAKKHLDAQPIPDDEDLYESENVAVIYIDGKPAAKYARHHEAERDANFMRDRFPNKKIEIKQEVRETELDENLHKWFKEKWVRFGPDGKIRGACARGDDSEGKPKCLPQKKAHALGKKGRKYAASKKRREDPNPDRRGKAKNVATKKANEEVQVNEKWSQKYKDSINCSNPKGFSQKAHCAGKKKNESINEEIPFNECPECRGPIVHESMMNEKQDACYHKVKARYKVWPSAYASGALVQCRKKGAKNWGNKSKANEGVIVGHDANDPEVAILGGAGTMSLSRLKKKAQGEAEQLANDLARGRFKAAAYNIKQLENTLKTIAAAEDEMSKKYFGEDYTGEFAAEKTPAINPYGGLKDTQHRSDIDEARQPHPLLKAVNKNLVDLASGEVRRREASRKAAEKGQRAASKYLKSLDKKPSTDEVWRKIEDAVANSFPDGDPYDMLWPWLERNGLNNDDVVRAAKKQGYKDLWDYWHILSRDIGHEVMNEMPDTSGPVGTQPGGWRRTNMEEDTAYAGGMGQGGYAGQSYRKFKPKSAGTFKEEEQLDEKCWDGYKQVGMKKKGDKMVPNCVAKESAIMRGLTGKRD